MYLQPVRPGRSSYSPMQLKDAACAQEAVKCLEEKIAQRQRDLDAATVALMRASVSNRGLHLRVNSAITTLLNLSRQTHALATARLDTLPPLPADANVAAVPPPRADSLTRLHTHEPPPPAHPSFEPPPAPSPPCGSLATPPACIAPISPWLPPLSQQWPLPQAASAGPAGHDDACMPPPVISPRPSAMSVASSTAAMPYPAPSPDSVAALDPGSLVPLHSAAHNHPMHASHAWLPYHDRTGASATAHGLYQGQQQTGEVGDSLSRDELSCLLDAEMEPVWRATSGCLWRRSASCSGGALAPPCGPAHTAHAPRRASVGTGAHASRPQVAAPWGGPGVATEVVAAQLREWLGPCEAAPSAGSGGWVEGKREAPRPHHVKIVGEQRWAAEGGAGPEGASALCRAAPTQSEQDTDAWPLPKAEERACMRAPAASAAVAAAAAAAADRVRSVSNELHAQRAAAAVATGAPVASVHGVVETPFALAPEGAPLLGFSTAATDHSCLCSMHVFMLAVQLECCFTAAALGLEGVARGACCACCGPVCWGCSTSPTCGPESGHPTCGCHL